MNNEMTSLEILKLVREISDLDGDDIKRAVEIPHKSNTRFFIYETVQGEFGYMFDEMEVEREDFITVKDENIKSSVEFFESWEIENTPENFDKFIPNRDNNAEPTSRCMQEHEKHLEEWSEMGTIEGVNCEVYWQFDSETHKDLPCDDYDWSYANVSDIVEQG